MASARGSSEFARDRLAGPPRSEPIYFHFARMHQPLPRESRGLRHHRRIASDRWKLAVSAARKAIAAATSWVRASRPIGTLARQRASPSPPFGLLAHHKSVSVGPGATAFAVM